MDSWSQEMEPNMPPTFSLRKYPPNTPLPAIYHDKVAAYCAEEVRRQQDTPWHVYKMMVAWKWAEGHAGERLTHGMVREIAAFIDEANENGYRTGRVFVGGHEKLGPEAVHAAMTDLLDNQDAVTPEQFYLDFENIHPFNDGNGRTGKVLYNFLLDRMDDPVWPPDFFGGIENP